MLILITWSVSCYRRCAAVFKETMENSSELILSKFIEILKRMLVVIL